MSRKSFDTEFLYSKFQVFKLQIIAICKNIKAFNWVNRKRFNILKTLLEYLENYIVIY